MTAWPTLPSDQGVYSISVASELTGIGPQTLRLYEDKGLVEPERTGGGTRRYSDEDVQRIRRVAELTAAGLNLAGVGLVLELEAENDRLRAQLEQALGDDR
ncbi:MAG TPA: helix-turn-helix transcriptional regulator [Jiangellaceae bacterium]